MDTTKRQKAMRESLANEVRARRARKRWSQSDLVDASGLSRSTVHRIESAARDMDVPQLIAIAAALDTTPVELLQSATDQLPE